MKKYRVYDTTGAWLRTFDSWKSAYFFCLIMGRRDWQIKQCQNKKLNIKDIGYYIVNKYLTHLLKEMVICRRAFITASY